MTDTARISAFAIGRGSWSDALRAARAMPHLFLVSAVLLLPVSGRTAMSLLGTAPGAWEALAIVVEIVARAAVATPIAVATHRFVLRSESAGLRQGLSPRQFGRFFAFAVMWSALFALPHLLQLAAQLNGLRNVQLASLVLFAPATIIALRTLVVFPAIAIGAPRASFGDAFAATTGQTWKVFATMVVAILPWLGLALVLEFGWAALAPALGPNGAHAALLPLDAAVTVLTTAGLAAAASRLYEALGGKPSGGDASSPGSTTVAMA